VNYANLMRFLPLVLALLALDQATKVWAVHVLSQAPIVLIPNLLFLKLATNPGAAFSLFARYPGALTVVASAVAVAVFIWLWRTPHWDWPTAVALSLILGGAVGNLIDRFRVGEVIDFIEVHFAVIHWSWPTFNVADSAICVGMGLLALSAFFPGKKRAQPAAPSPGAP